MRLSPSFSARNASSGLARKRVEGYLKGTCLPHLAYWVVFPHARAILAPLMLRMRQTSTLLQGSASSRRHFERYNSILTAAESAVILSGILQTSGLTWDLNSTSMKVTGICCRGGLRFLELSWLIHPSPGVGIMTRPSRSSSTWNCLNYSSPVLLLILRGPQPTRTGSTNTGKNGLGGPTIPSKRSSSAASIRFR